MCRLAALHPHFGEVMAAEGDKLLKAVTTKLTEGKDLVRKKSAPLVRLAVGWWLLNVSRQPALVLSR